MRRFLTILALLALVACGGGSSVSTAAKPVKGGGGGPPPPTQWTLWFSPGATLGAGPSFSFPTWISSSCPGPTGFNQVCPSVHYLVNASGGAITGKTMTMTVTISGNNPVWNYQNIEQDGNTCTFPASVRFFIQRGGDSWSGTGQYEFYRWWSTNSIQLGPGTFTLTVPLDPSAGWTDVSGQPATANPAAFSAALANAQTVGMTFGGGCFYGHGVDLLSGSANFTVNSWSVQ